MSQLVTHKRIIDNVSTRKYNLDMKQGIITKTGNSYAIRVPKSYITDNHLQLGDKVDLVEPIAQQQAALRRLVEAGKRNGPIMADPVAWQRQQRNSDDPWESVIGDSARQ